MNPTWESDCGTVKLWLGDCLEVMASWPDGAVDAVVTDPPYGVGIGRQSLGKWRTSKMPKSSCDDVQVDISPILIGEKNLVWGGNYFQLPPSRCWLVWNKGAGFKNRDFAEAELAWCSWDGNIREITHDPLAAGDYRSKQHPTQKPIAVMVASIMHSKGETIADPFMGSGTTGVAAVRLGRKFWGVETDPQYFEIAKRRIQDELAKVKFLEPQPVVEQGCLFGGDA